MKKVLFTATVDSHILAFHLPFLKWFHENGYEVHVATNGKEEIPYCDKKIVIPFERSPFKMNNIKAIGKLKKVILNEKYDMIHTHTPMGSVVTRLAAKKARKQGTRVIYTAHGFHFYKGAPKLNWFLFYPVEKYLSKYTDTLILINNEDYELAKSKFKRCKNIEYVPGVGIDENKFNFEMNEQEKESLRKSLGLTKDSFVLIYPARLDKNKNQLFLIQCMEELVKKNKDIHLLLPGIDELNGFYQKIVEEKNLNENIHFLGFRKDIPRLMKISDIAVSSSKREGLPVNTMEAFACGLPVVAYHCRGMNDLISQDINGYVIHNQNDFINNILMLMNDKNKYDVISKNNILKIKNYNLENVLEKMKDIYQQKKVVLHVLASNKYSGAENVACTIINCLKDKYEMIYCSPDGLISDSLKEKNISYVPLKKLSIWELKKVIKKYNPNIIHAHDFKASCVSIFFSKNRKIISHVHQNSDKMRKVSVYSILYRLATSKFHSIFWVAKSAFEEFIFKNHVKHKSVILYNVIDKDLLIKKANENTYDDSFDLIYLGRLTEQKNPERLIEIIKLLVQKKKDIKIAIVGDGDKRATIDELIEKYQLSKNITMYGFQQNPYPILLNSKILIMTSIMEGMPMVVLEAQALGKPIISTPVDGLKEVIKNGYNGYLLENNQDFQEKIIELLENEKLLNQMSKNSVEFFHEYNNLDNYAFMIDDKYSN